MQAPFVTFEGCEGSGKSTLVKLLKQRLEEKGLKVLTTREPGGTPFAEELRKLLLSQNLDPQTELLMLEAGRSHHVHSWILPHLCTDFWVLCDRFTGSTLAYQGYGRGLPLEFIESLNQFACHGLRPNLTFYLRLPIELGLKRVSHKNRFEKESLDFHQRVQEAYQKILAQDPETWVCLDVLGKNEGEVLQEVMKHLEQRKLCSA